jgi:exodeoxyribonuclease VII small subunit
VSRKRSSPPDFEQALAELEALVEKMEQGDLSLEESLQSFERGIQLTRNCQQALQAAEQKVQILLDKDGGAQLEDFASSDD